MINLFLIIAIVKQTPLHDTDEPKSFFEKAKFVLIPSKILFLFRIIDLTLPLLKIIPLNIFKN